MTNDTSMICVVVRYISLNNALGNALEADADRQAGAILGYGNEERRVGGDRDMSRVTEHNLEANHDL